MARRAKKQAPRIPTSERLAHDLEAANAPREMIERARQGWYDDYRSPLGFPISALVNDARFHGLKAIAEAAIAGNYDGQQWEANAWAESPEGQQALAELGGVRDAMRRDGKAK